MTYICNNIIPKSLPRCILVSINSCPLSIAWLGKGQKTSFSEQYDQIYRIRFFLPAHHIISKRIYRYILFLRQTELEKLCFLHGYFNGTFLRNSKLSHSKKLRANKSPFADVKKPFSEIDCGRNLISGRFNIWPIWYLLYLVSGRFDIRLIWYPADLISDRFDICYIWYLADLISG